MDNKIRITYEEIDAPKVDEILAQESAYKTAMGSKAGAAEGEKESLIYKSWFNLMIAGLIGALIAWGIMEPSMDDAVPDAGKGFLLFALVGGLAAFMIGSVEGILARNYGRALKGGVIGLVVGFVGGIFSNYAANVIFFLTLVFGFGVMGAGDPRHSLMGFITAVIARSLAWMVAGMTVGLGPGMALKSKKLTLNGFIGGMIGGLIGGILFDPINWVVSGGTLETGVEISRAIGFCVIGAMAGYMIGIVEMLAKNAWLLMTAGPLKGKQFIVYKNPTIIGSSPKCEVYIFKDPAIEPFHAAVHTVRDGYEIEDKNTPGGTWINGQKIKRKRLQGGDEIKIGEAKFTYSEKEKSGKK